MKVLDLWIIFLQNLVLSVTEWWDIVLFPFNLRGDVSNQGTHWEEDEPAVKNKDRQEEDAMARCKDGVKESNNLGLVISHDQV